MRNNYRNMFFAGYGCSNQQQNSSPLPTRAGLWGTVYSPFRNTNMSLQDITMNSTVHVTPGTNARSPGKTSQAGAIGARDRGGRTMKDYEDQLEALKKENFNLKLRIYFLEERMGITSVDENAIKKNIELKVENESLRKELVEKQELLSQAAKAIQLIEEQKEVCSRNEIQYQQTLEAEREKIRKLEKELTEYQEKADASIYYKQAFGITSEKAVDTEEKLRQMEEVVASLEAEVEQVTSSLNEERGWTQELETERDELRERLEAEARVKENLTAERLQESESLREKVKELEEELLKKDVDLQQCRNDQTETKRLNKELNAQLENKCQTFDELNAVAEKRKKQIEQLRTSIKTRDDALTDLNNKHRSLLSQFENGYVKRSIPSSSSGMKLIDEPLQSRLGQKLTNADGLTIRENVCLDWEPNRERSPRSKSPTDTLNGETKSARDLVKELEEKDNEIKRRQEKNKQLVLKLCNMQKHAENVDYKLKKLETDHEKAIKTIQGFMERQQQLENSKLMKEQKIMELEIELHRLREGENSNMRRDRRDDYNPSNQQRFDEMEAKINDLRDQIETIKAEKSRLETQIQVESQELLGRVQDREQKIEILEIEKTAIKEQLEDKVNEFLKLKETTKNETESLHEREDLLRKLQLQDGEIEEKNRKIEQLTKELQVKTQNLQQLVNTELWSKNKEIAKLHNHMTANSSHERIRNKSDIVHESAGTQLSALIKELNDIGIKVTFTNEVIQLNYVDGNEPIDVKTMTDYVQKLLIQKNELEKEVDYLKWLKLVSRPDFATEMDGYGDNQTEKDRKYCELLRTHLKELVKFMKEMLKNGDYTDTIGNEHKKIVLDVLTNSRILSEDFLNALEGISTYDIPISVEATNVIRSIDGRVKKSRSENLLSATKNQTSTQSDSEAFSEPDRTVSMARIGLQEMQQKSVNRPRFSKYTKTFTDSEDSLEYVPYHKTYQNDLNDTEANHQIQELKETNAFLYSELSALRNELTAKTSFDCAFDEKISPLIVKLEKSQKFCEKLQTSLERRVHEVHTLKKESKLNNARRAQLENKLVDLESMAAEMNKQKAELLHYKENAERKAADVLITLNRENDMLRTRIKKLEDENEAAKANMMTLTKELDHLTLSHSQILVENTKLTNDKIRLEQEIRKTESRCDLTVRNIHDKFNKEISDLNQINESHRARMHELEVANKELRRHVAVCDASDSAPSSSGVSSIPADGILKQTCEDIMQEYQAYNNSQYWFSMNYPTTGGRSKSSCSPDLGIESDAAVTTMRPLKDTLKITESMTNLLSDEDSSNGNGPIRKAGSESPLPIEGLDEVDALKQENETLKRRLMKTRRALEDTFQHLSASNKNKKNVEKAITKQLQITKSILKKTRTFEEPLDN